MFCLPFQRVFSLVLFLFMLLVIWTPVYLLDYRHSKGVLRVSIVALDNLLESYSQCLSQVTQFIIWSFEVNYILPGKSTSLQQIESSANGMMLKAISSEITLILTSHRIIRSLGLLRKKPLDKSNYSPFTITLCLLFTGRSHFTSKYYG